MENNTIIVTEEFFFVKEEGKWIAVNERAKKELEIQNKDVIKSLDEMIDKCDCIEVFKQARNLIIELVMINFLNILEDGDNNNGK